MLMVLTMGVEEVIMAVEEVIMAAEEVTQIT